MGIKKFINFSNTNSRHTIESVRQTIVPRKDTIISATINLWHKEK